MNNLIIKFVIGLLIINCSIYLNIVHADRKPTIKYKGEDGEDQANDFHIIFKDKNVVVDSGGCFTEELPRSPDDVKNGVHHFSGCTLRTGDENTMKWHNPQGLGTGTAFKKAWWTYDGKVLYEFADNKDNVIGWNGGAASGNGSILVSISGINAMFHSTPGFSTSQTAASFMSFIHANFNSGGRNLIQVEQLAPNKVEVVGNKIEGIPIEILSLSLVSQDPLQPCTIAPYVPSFFDIIVELEGFYNPNTNKMISDYGTIYLRSGTTPYPELDFDIAWLDSNGKALCWMYNAVNGTPYYIDVVHRNSIETYSYDGLNRFISNHMTYDFSTGPNKAFGNNLKHKGTEWCIYSGDINQDGLVDAGDISLADNAAYNYLTGYVAEDVTGDNLVDASDISITDNNAYDYVMKITPP